MTVLTLLFNGTPQVRFNPRQAVAIRGVNGEPPAHDAGIRNGVKYKERKTFLPCALLHYKLYHR